MKFWGIIFTIMFFDSAVAKQNKLPIIHGKIQLHANCIQCGGRFLCGHTDEVASLSYNRKILRQSIKAHCAQKSNDISEALRIKGSATSEEELRYQKYHEDILLSIDANKGGRLRFKEEKGFAYADFFKYLQPAKNLNPSERKKVLGQNKQQVQILKSDNTLLPVLSIQDFKDTRGEMVRPGRLEAEYQDYIKNLMVAHPSYLIEEPKGSGLYIKSLSQNSALQERLAKKFGLGGRDVASLGGGGGSSPGKASGGVSANNAEKVDDSGLGKPADEVIYDQNGKNITSELRKDAEKKAKQEKIRIADEAQNKKERNKGSFQQKQLSMFKSGGPSMNYWTDSSFRATASAITGSNPITDVCNGNNTDQTRKKISQYTNTIIEKGGASDGYTSDAQFNDLREGLIQATRLGSVPCREKTDGLIKQVFNSNGDKKTAQQMVADLDNSAEVRRSRKDTFVDDGPSVRMIASNTTETPSLESSAGNTSDSSITSPSESTPPVVDLTNPNRAENARMMVVLGQERAQRVASKGVGDKKTKPDTDSQEAPVIDTNNGDNNLVNILASERMPTSYSFDCSSWDLIASKVAHKSISCEADLASACNKKITDAFYSKCLELLPDILASEDSEKNLKMCKKIISPAALKPFNFDLDYQPGKKIKDKDIYKLSSDINSYMPVHNTMKEDEKKLKFITKLVEKSFGITLGRHGIVDLEVKPPKKFCDKVSKTVFEDGNLVSSGFNLMEEKTIEFFYSHESDNKKDKKEKAFLYRFFASGQAFNQPKSSNEDICKKIHSKFHALAMNSLNKDKVEKQLNQTAIALQANLKQLAKEEDIPAEILELGIEDMKAKSPVYAELIRQGAILKYYTPGVIDYSLPRLGRYTESCSGPAGRVPAGDGQATN